MAGRQDTPRLGPGLETNGPVPFGRKSSQQPFAQQLVRTTQAFRKTFSPWIGLLSVCPSVPAIPHLHQHKVPGLMSLACSCAGSLILWCVQLHNVRLYTVSCSQKFAGLWAHVARRHRPVRRVGLVIAPTRCDLRGGRPTGTHSLHLGNLISTSPRLGQPGSQARWALVGLSAGYNRASERLVPKGPRSACVVRAPGVSLDSRVNNNLHPASFLPRQTSVRFVLVRVCLGNREDTDPSVCTHLQAQRHNQ
ncbi:unnamed protein product [Protopolystoma xenopodis]|uniref:Uncharacterized protein n=1 Tax=Protopolystoma xenopodis TaxID=117903 RepID=A0A3S5FFX4_9PLAT|nr:unnamed protein product [Protopolystoma xenopodis]